MFKKNSALCFLWITLLVFAVDYGTKELALAYLDPYVPRSVMPYFNLTLAYNTGAAFSFLNMDSIWPNIFFGCIALSMSIVILVWLYRLPREECVMGIALCFILGGALGNLSNRIEYSHVIDFIDIYVSGWHWPVFNIADAAVSIGAFLIIWKWMKSR